MILKATYKLSDIKIDTPVSISNFILEPVPERPNDTYLRFEFTHHQIEKRLFDVVEKINA